MANILEVIGKVTIVVDSREHKLVKIFSDMEKLLAKDNIIVKYAEINSADFAIMIDNKLHMLIERKTISDYAESIKDKRIEKRNIMYEQRKLTKCDLSFIIEGDISNFLTSEANAKTCGIMNSALRTSIFNLQVRDKMFLYYSPSLLDSALIIYNLAKAYFRNNGSEQQIESKKISEEIILTMPVGCSDCEILAKMFLVIPGVTKQNLHLLINHTFNEVYTLCASQSSNELKTAVGTRVINSFISINTNDGKDLFWRVISQIPHVSENYKSKVYPVAGYNEFILLTPTIIEQILHILAQKTSTVTININRMLMCVKLDTTKNKIQELTII